MRVNVCVCVLFKVTKQYKKNVNETQFVLSDENTLSLGSHLEARLV